jgi:hypothetical protein
MAGTPTDFIECVSKGELTTFMIEQRNLMTELTRNVNNLVTRIEQLEQHPPPVTPIFKDKNRMHKVLMCTPGHDRTHK